MTDNDGGLAHADNAPFIIFRLLSSAYSCLWRRVLMLTLPTPHEIHNPCCVMAHAHKNLAGVMVEAVTGDYESMDYSTESAGAVLETFVVLSSEPNALGSDSQVFSCKIQRGGAGRGSIRAVATACTELFSNA